jgi:hypothetical protein
VTVTDVAWSRDGHRRQVLELKLDGRPLHISTSQRPELLGRGIVKGVVFLESERIQQLPNPFIAGDYAPTLTPHDLVGCTDNPQVFALYQAMCEAIRTDQWRAGPRPTPPPAWPTPGPVAVPRPRAPHL